MQKELLKNLFATLRNRKIPDFGDVPPREMCTSEVDFRSKVLKTAVTWGIWVARGVTMICTHAGAIISKGTLHHFGVGQI